MQGTAGKWEVPSSCMPRTRCSLGLCTVCHSPGACLQGHRKPAPGSFQCAVEHLGLPPSDLLLIDDRLPNVEGARQAGLQAIQFASALQLDAELRAAGLAF